MTNEEFQKALSLVREAFKSGAVQCCTMYDCDFSDEKPDVVHVSLHPTVKYRIKPQPREIFIAEHDWRFGADAEDRIGHAYLTPGRGGRWCKFREVLE